jgi:hypothetical protein
MNRGVFLRFRFLFLVLLSDRVQAEGVIFSETLKLRVSESVYLGGEPFPCQLGDLTSILRVRIAPYCFGGEGADPFPGTSGGT